MDLKNTYISKINNLKSDIQNLLESKTISNDFDNLKNKKLNELKDLTFKLKELTKEERREKLKLKELTNVQSMVDSIEYYQQVHRKKEDKPDIKTIKEKREQAQQDYIDTMSVQKRYEDKDPKLTPAFLFFHSNILEKYGLCPYIQIKENDTSDNIYSYRKKWLSEQEDQGKIYFDLYEKLIEKKDLRLLELHLVDIEKQFSKIVNYVLSDSQKELYNTSCEYIEEYINAPVKTKRIKEKFKVITNNLSILYNETTIPLYLYLCEKYNLIIRVNNINSNSTPKIDKLSYYLQEFQNLLENYKETNKKIQSTTKFIQNTINNLRFNQNHFIQHNKLPTNLMYNNINTNTIKQKGNYFKKWSKLNEEERSDRFLSFSSYYVDKKLIMSQLIDNNQREELILSLHTKLINWYEQKLLRYKYIKWNIQSGVIENISNMNYNTTSKEFEFTGTLENKKSSEIKKKPVTTKSIFTSENEKIVNDEILIFILKEKQNNSEISDTDNKKEELFEIIKNKLKLKRILSKDKEYLNSKFDEIYNIISKGQV